MEEPIVQISSAGLLGGIEGSKALHYKQLASCC